MNYYLSIILGFLDLCFCTVYLSPGDPFFPSVLYFCISPLLHSLHLPTPGHRLLFSFILPFSFIAQDLHHHLFPASTISLVFPLHTFLYILHLCPILFSASPLFTFVPLFTILISKWMRREERCQRERGGDTKDNYLLENGKQKQEHKSGVRVKTKDDEIKRTNLETTTTMPTAIEEIAEARKVSQR